MMYRIEFPIFNKPITPEITHKDSKISDFNADYKLKIDTFEDWQVAGRDKQAYGFKYDDLDRLTDATYFDLTDVNTNGQWNSTYSTDNKFWEKATYDVRGNITALKRNGYKWGAWTTNGYTAANYSLIDDLAYTYNSQNQVTYIHDAAPNPSLPPNVFGGNTKGFVENNQVNMMAGDHYEYDNNGNMKADKHKGMTIEYNYLNLPQVITFSGNRTITFVYDASGVKLQKITNDNGAKITYNYVNGVEYKEDVLQRLAHTEGAVVRNEFGAYDQEYVLRDHLGNVRVMFKDGTNKGDAYFDYYTWQYFEPNAGNTGYNDGVITQDDIKTINNMYPFGMDMEGNWNGSFDVANNKYKYNEKEWNNDFGLGLYDYGARFYDPAIGRWNSLDPMAEKYLGWSAYNYAASNPIKFIDPTGAYIEISYQDEKGVDQIIRYNKGDKYEGNSSYVTNVFAALDYLIDNSPTEENIVGDLANDKDYNWLIVQSPYENHTKKIGEKSLTDGTVTLAFEGDSFATTTFSDELGYQTPNGKQAPVTTLYHEAGHAAIGLEKYRLRQKVSGLSSDSEKYKKIEKEMQDLRDKYDAPAEGYLNNEEKIVNDKYETPLAKQRKEGTRNSDFGNKIYRTKGVFSTEPK